MPRYKLYPDERYRVGTDGSFWSRIGCRGGQLKKTWTRLHGAPHHRGGHLVVNLAAGKRRIHQLVMEAFKGPCPPGMEVCHENGVETDNRLSNLRWKSHGDNMRDKKRHGTECRGETRPMAKLTDAIVLEARQRADTGETHHRIAADYGVSRPTMTKAIRRQTWKHV